LKNYACLLKKGFLKLVPILKKNVITSKTHMKKALLIISLLFLAEHVFSQVCINEILASNNTSLPDATGETYDWIELYNESDESIDLAGYQIGESKNSKYSLSLTSKNLNIPAKGYLILFASGEPNKGDKHLGFKLNKSGQRLYLFDSNGKKIDRITYKSQKTNYSSGRETDGSRKWRYFEFTTPNITNNEATAYKGFTRTPYFSKSGGYHKNSLTLKIKKRSLFTEIYYTTDASTPSPNNLEGKKYTYKNSYREKSSDPANTPLLTSQIDTYTYNKKLKLEDASLNPNRTSLKSSTYHRSPNYFPNYALDKTNTIRAVAVKKNRLPSEPISSSFFINSNGQKPYTFPVLSLMIDENELFDYKKGIYTAGQVFDTFRTYNLDPIGLCTEGNYNLRGSLNEKIGNIEYIKKNQASVNFKIRARIHGACTRAFAYKSFRIYEDENFKGYDFFNEGNGLRQNSILLRNSGNDYNKTLFKDAYIHTLVKDLNIPTQKSQPSILFLNGEYWGIHNIRERVDNEYISKKYNVSDNNLDLIKVVFYGPEEVEQGDKTAYQNLISFFKTSDLKNEGNFEKAKELIDIDNFIDFQIAHIYVGNIDWPQNNVRLWRYKTEVKSESSKNADGRWRWLFFDAERSLGETVNAEFDNLNTARYHPSNIIFTRLLDNPTFKAQFVERFNFLLTTTFKAENALLLFDKFQNQYAPEIDAHTKRWKVIADKKAWEANCDYVRDYLETRPAFVKKHLLNLSGDVLYDSVLVKNTNTELGSYLVSMGASKTNSATINTTKEQFSFPRDNTFLLLANPKNEQTLSYWNVDGQRFYEKEIEVKSNSNIELYWENSNESNDTNSNEAFAIANQKNPQFFISEGISANGDGLNEFVVFKLLDQSIELEEMLFFDKYGSPIPFKTQEEDKQLKVIFEKNVKGIAYYVISIKNEKSKMQGFITIE
jgi:hypothetical protein